MPYIIDPVTGKQIWIDAATGQVIGSVGESNLNNQEGDGQQPQQDRGFVSGFLKSLVDPLYKAGKDLTGSAVVAGSGVAEIAHRSLLDKENESKFFDKGIQAGLDIMTPEARAAVTGEGSGGPLNASLADIAEVGSRRGAGVAQYMVPGGGTAAKRIATGAASGAMGAFANDEATVEDVAKGALVGGAISGAFEGVGALLKGGRSGLRKVGKTLAKRGENVKVSQYVKSVGGKPINREGGNALLLNMKKVGIKPGDVDEIIAQTDELIDMFSPVVGEQMDELTTKGAVVSVDDLTAPLEKKLTGKMIASDRSRLQSIVDDVKSFAGNKDTLTPNELYVLKQRMGQLGRWNSNSSADELARGELWKDLYIKANDITEELLEKNGFGDFREINEILHTAINARSYAERIGNKAPNLNGLGLLDVVLGAGGYGAGGITGLVTLPAVSRVINSPTIASATGDAMESVGNRLATGQIPVPKLPNLPAGTAQLMRNVATGAGGDSVVDPEDQQSQRNDDAYNDQTQQAQDETHTNIISDQPFGGLSRQEVLSRAVAQGATRTELEEIGQIYDYVMAQQQTPQSFINETTSVGYSSDQLFAGIMNAYASGDEKSAKFLERMYDMAIKEEERKGKASKAEEPTAQQTAKAAVNQLRTLFGRGNAASVGTKDDLALGGEGGLIRETAGRAAGATKRVTDPEYSDDLQVFKNTAIQTLGLFTQAFGSGTPQDAEAQRLLASIPGPGTSDKVAKEWFNQVEALLEAAGAMGVNIPQQMEF